MSQEIINHLESEAYYTKTISERNTAILGLLRRISELEALIEELKQPAPDQEVRPTEE